MNQLLLATILTLLSASAMADWTMEDKSDSLTAYADLSNISKDNDFLRIWTLYDLKTPSQTESGKAYLSDLIWVEFDCVKKQKRDLSFALTSEHMGYGNLVEAANTPDTDWETVPPQSVMESFMVVACHKS